MTPPPPDADPEHEYDRASIPTLLGILADDEISPGQRSDAACALGDRLRCKEIPGFDADVMTALESCLTDPVFSVQFEAAIALAEAQNPLATPVLQQACSYRSLRLDAIRALGAGGDQLAVPALIKLMQRMLLPWADNLQAAGALCALGNIDGQRFLQHKMNSRRRAEQAAAIHFIGESRHPEAFDILRQLYDRPAVRDVAARALGFVDSPPCVPFLRQAFAEATGELREDLAESLRMRGVAVDAD